MKWTLARGAESLETPGLSTFNLFTWIGIHQRLLKKLKQMKKSKSQGTDELSQENMILGADALIGPLTVIINLSIKEGSFPKGWKEAVVTPVHIITFLYG